MVVTLRARPGGNCCLRKALLGRASRALGPTPDAARERAYDAAGRIGFDGMQMRTDIAARAVDRAAAG